MSLISREKVRRLICENNDKYGYSDRFHEFTDEVLNNLPSAFEGMTNGEVMKAVYADSEIFIDETWKTVTVYLGANEDYCEDEVRFDLDWWNTPYKAESEGTECQQ